MDVVAPKSNEVYPRVCGGSVPTISFPQPWQGLSPRVRGKRLLCRRQWVSVGSIPACAGEASMVVQRPACWRVYPRVCGGSPSPRPAARAAAGLSPRVRGKQRRSLIGAECGRSIPACAGEAPAWYLSRHHVWVYPRVCGGSAKIVGIMASIAGLSPRVRGKHKNNDVTPESIRSIPACAGEACLAAVCQNRLAVYPRVCGGSRPQGNGRTLAEGLSPRVRGKLACIVRRAVARRSIPACAGEASLASRSDRSAEVYPRVCGGSFLGMLPEAMVMGLSPRVRGKPSR